MGKTADEYMKEGNEAKAKAEEREKTAGQKKATLPKKDIDGIIEEAERKFREAGKAYDDAGGEYATNKDSLNAALAYDQAADAYANAARLNKDESSQEYEQNLQHQISELLKAAEQYEKNGKKTISKDKKDKAQKIQDDYANDHKNSKLQQSTDGTLKK